MYNKFNIEREESLKIYFKERLCSHFLKQQEQEPRQVTISLNNKQGGLILKPKDTNLSIVTMVLIPVFTRKEGEDLESFLKQYKRVCMANGD